MSPIMDLTGFLSRNRRLAWAIGVIVVAGVGFAAYWLLRPPPVGVEVGMRAPEFTLEDLGGNPVSLGDLRGKVVVIEFWQSTCPDCRRALPELVATLMPYLDEGVVILGVNLDHDVELAREYLQAQGLDAFITTLHESFDKAMDVVDLFHVPLVPYTILIDRRGIIRFAGTYPDTVTPDLVERWL